ncbi:MAG: hypothetical protein EZS28_027164 [Streblomastix strix]|uniref:Uncharacterized protein n=1 Tax=Streblomastix strix TaxID=222440 RepID=A0A5J4V3H0_9EUKA|nr:MAG: hypothetical protein EZS28_027164 [Streblomastix strix]
MPDSEYQKMMGLFEQMQQQASSLQEDIEQKQAKYESELFADQGSSEDEEEQEQKEQEKTGAKKKNKNKRARKRKAQKEKQIQADKGKQEQEKQDNKRNEQEKQDSQGKVKGKEYLTKEMQDFERKLNQIAEEEQKKRGNEPISQFEQEQKAKIVKGLKDIISSTTQQFMGPSFDKLNKVLSKEINWAESDWNVGMLIAEQMSVCKQIIEIFSRQIDEYMRILVLEDSIVDNLLRITLTYEFLGPHMDDFAVALQTIIGECNDEFRQKMLLKKPFPSFLHLISYQREPLVSIGIKSINSLICSEFSKLTGADPCSIYQQFNSCDGITVIYNQFKRNLNKSVRDASAICLGFVFRSKEITNQKWRSEVVIHLKTLSSGKDPEMKKNANVALKLLAKNPGVIYK